MQYRKPSIYEVRHETKLPNKYKKKDKKIKTARKGKDHNQRSTKNNNKRGRSNKSTNVVEKHNV